MKNAKMTNAQALTAAVKLFNATGTDRIAEVCGVEFDQVTLLVNKINHMCEVANHSRKRNTKPTPAQRRAMAKAAEAEDYICSANRPVSWEDISDHVSDLLTSQKVTSIMKKVLAKGSVERVVIKGRVFYQAKTAA